MTAAQLGRRTGVSQNAISEAEAAEPDGRLTINRLRRIAEGLNCDIAYALVPRTSLDAMVTNQANRLASRVVGEIAHGMDLEAQSTDRASQEAEIARIRDQLVAQGSSRIWE